MRERSRLTFILSVILLLAGCAGQPPTQVVRSTPRQYQVLEWHTAELPDAPKVVTKCSFVLENGTTVIGDGRNCAQVEKLVATHGQGFFTLRRSPVAWQ